MICGGLTTLTSLVKYKVTILSSVLCFGLVVFVTKKIFLHAEEKEKKRCRKQQKSVSVFQDRTSAKLKVEDVIVLNQVLDDLIICINDVEHLMDNLHKDVGTRKLEDGVIHLKKLLANYNELSTPKKNSAARSEEEVIHQNDVICFDNDGQLDALGEEEAESCSTFSEDSFVSASEFQDIQQNEIEVSGMSEEIEDFLKNHSHLELYTAGIKEYSVAPIPVRKLRTKMLNCTSDADFMIKVFCLRLAFQKLFENESWKTWFLELGRKNLVEFLMEAEKDHASFVREFDAIISYCQEESNWIDIQEELEGRRVCEMSFYDIVLDFIIMDSFEDLEEPPYALLAVIQNGWIPNSVKETALATAVWSLLKGKTQMLTNQNAFMSRMYQVSQYLTPVLVWGFLGPDQKLNRICRVFKENMLGFLKDIFSLQKANYENLQTLADDIIKIAKFRTQHNASVR